MVSTVVNGMMRPWRTEDIADALDLLHLGALEKPSAIYGSLRSDIRNTDQTWAAMDQSSYKAQLETN